MKPYFVNSAFEKAVEDYLNSREHVEGTLHNSFLVVVIRMLINIYGELDIINPYQMKDELALDYNLMKFGLTKEKLLEFKILLDNFYRVDMQNKTNTKKVINRHFIEVQKRLIDMFNLKRLNYGMTDTDRKEFFDLLYTPGTSSPIRLSYNFLNADDVYEIAEYYKVATAKEKVVKEEQKDLLSFDVYKLFGFNVADLSKMNGKEIDELNEEIYSSFDISENAINKDYLLNESIKAYKMRRNPITTGNGYVDILLIMSVIVTTIMVVVIFGTIII